MESALKPCAKCRGKTHLAAMQDLVVEEGPLKMTVRGMPAATCANGHAGPVDRDFLLWLLHELRERQGGLPGAQARGLVFKKYHCSCGKELPGKSVERRAFAFDVAFEGTPAFKVELEMPLFRCSCGREQLRSLDELRKATTNAMVGLCDRAGFPHSG